MRRSHTPARNVFALSGLWEKRLICEPYLEPADCLPRGGYGGVKPLQLMSVL
ncbi:hypothetical protein BH18ACT9_BH18ACT9_19200 [soil metagenome]